ncbi:MAG: rRNA pseudouridine synthase [Desulfotomaculum sp.]|nr:rRNA pseudouridine synthase [Desulfotomaculum sp.]
MGKSAKENQRIDKILANMGYGTRKEIKQLIKKGLVTVDGRVVNNPGAHVNPYTSTIKVNDTVVKYKKYVYIMMNKPAGVLSATRDSCQHTVLDLLEDKYTAFKVSPVGRLDKDTEGLLLLTNDGKLAHELLSPKKKVPKNYYAVIKGRVTKEDAETFKNGVVLDDGYKTLPAELEIIKSGETSEVKITIYEGKYHQVKRMFRAVEKKVNYLKRLAMGELQLDTTLAPGEYRELTEQELNMLKKTP